MPVLRFGLRANKACAFRHFVIYSNAQIKRKNAKDHTPGGCANPGGYRGVCALALPYSMKEEG